MAKLQEPSASFENRPIIPTGEHILTLVDTKAFDKKIAPQFRKKDKEGNVVGPDTRPSLLWIFESNRTDEEGTNYQYCISTGFAYSDPRAKLTALIDMLIPGISYQEAVNLDTETLHGRKWKAMIQHRPDENDKNKFWPNHLYLIPVETKKAGKNTPSAPLTEEDSPYADE